ncbi:MAG: sporulation inhibitor of replication protein SirA [Bacilli bacterium]|nr:sporulation inhibitor of replication protein SirA [Bacilli bacterium]
MKTYYIFKIKKEFVNLYKDTPSVLYNILKNIYYLEREEADYGYNLFKQLTIPLNKNKLDRDIFLKFHQDIPYSKRKNTHYINNLYRNEISRLTINNSYLKLEVEQNFSTFFKILEEESDDLFACPFKKVDFFFLNEYNRKILV